MPTRRNGMRFLSMMVLALMTMWLTSTTDAWHKLPRKCCWPDVFEADVKNMATTSRSRDIENRAWAKYSYDFENGRWAIDYRDPDDRKSRRVIYDYKTNSRFVIFYEGCFNTSINAEMTRSCVPENATYHGYYTHPGQEPSLGYDVWSFEHFFLPLRSILKMSRDRCLPMQDSVYSLFRNYFRWYEGEPECNAWMYPAKATDGECFRCHTRITIERPGPRPSAFISNMDFRSVNLTITNHDIFKIPPKCNNVDEWPSSLPSNDFWRIFMLKSKME